MASELMAALIEAALAGSLAILLVVALRVPVRRRLGARAAYALWTCVPFACIAVLLPAREAEIQWAIPLATLLPPAPVLPSAAASSWPLATWGLSGWAAGLVVMALWQVWQQRCFVRALGALVEAMPGVFVAQARQGLPAAFGVLRPRVVLPDDFHLRYTDEEQALVLCHERLHVRRGDLVANLLASLLRSLFWFNPLVHVAAHLHRLDQEFACDAMVMARHPAARRRYGEAMLKAQLAHTPLPAGCHWSNLHLLKERIAMLKQPLPSRAHRVVAAAVLLMSVTATSLVAWAAQPATSQQVDGDFHYRIRATLDVDGEARSFSLRDGPGRHVGMAATTKAGRDWRIEFVVTPAQENGQVRIEGDIRLDGKPLSAPVLIAALDKEAAIRVTSADGASSFALTMTVTRHVGMPRADATGIPKQPAPAYPAEARDRQQSGHVVLKLKIGPDGRVRDAIVEKSVPAGVFDAASLDAAKEWTFDPPTDNGIPVEGWVRVPIRYDVDGDADEGGEARHGGTATAAGMHG
ncbi:MAG: TonB family protein [Pseudoxanthomonas mexicana]|nr:TonB family protein [Pseudoxanthomonas mexicana]